MKTLTQPNEAFASANQGNGFPVGWSASFVCPHPDCRVYAEHKWGVVRSLSVAIEDGGIGGRNIENADTVVLSSCNSCRHESVFVNSRLTWPLQSSAPNANSDLPDELKIDFNEARMILPQSPRGAAALLRLVIQKLLPFLGATKKDINAAIGELVENQVINKNLQKALDSVRVIGNEAVHPGTLDLRDDDKIAISLFNLVNFIVQKGISEPKEIAQTYEALPESKLAGIKQRDGV